MVETPKVKYHIIPDKLTCPLIAFVNTKSGANQVWFYAARGEERRGEKRREEERRGEERRGEERRGEVTSRAVVVSYEKIEK